MKMNKREDKVKNSMSKIASFALKIRNFQPGDLGSLNFSQVKEKVCKSYSNFCQICTKGRFPNGIIRLKKL